jgi:hypothetical protein
VGGQDLVRFTGDDTDADTDAALVRCIGDDTTAAVGVVLAGGGQDRKEFTPGDDGTAAAVGVVGLSNRSEFTPGDDGTDATVGVVGLANRFEFTPGNDTAAAVGVAVVVVAVGGQDRFEFPG